MFSYIHCQISSLQKYFVFEEIISRFSMVEAKLGIELEKHKTSLPEHLFPCASFHWFLSSKWPIWSPPVIIETAHFLFCCFQKRIQEMLKQIDEADQPQVVRLGDASIASPFTSKLSSVMAGKQKINWFDLLSITLEQFLCESQE